MSIMIVIFHTVGHSITLLAPNCKQSSSAVSEFCNPRCPSALLRAFVCLSSVEPHISQRNYLDASDVCQMMRCKTWKFPFGMIVVWLETFLDAPLHYLSLPFSVHFGSALPFYWESLQCWFHSTYWFDNSHNPLLTRSTLPSSIVMHD